MQLSEEHRGDPRQVVDAGPGRGHAQGHADHLPQLPQPRQAQDRPAQGSRAEHSARVELLEGELHFLCSR